MEQFMNKMYELYLDMLQDVNANTRTEERYDILINGIFNNLRLDYNGTSLMIRSDEGFISILKALEPKRCEQALNELQQKLNKEED